MKNPHVGDAIIATAIIHTDDKTHLTCLLLIPNWNGEKTGKLTTKDMVLLNEDHRYFDSNFYPINEDTLKKDSPLLGLKYEIKHIKIDPYAHGSRPGNLWTPIQNR